MQNQNYRNPTKPFTIVAAIATILNILITLFLGFVSFYAIGVGDPANDSVDIEAFITQKHLELSVVKALTMFFVIGFIISPILWLRRKRYGNFIFSGLALIHFFVLIYCINVIWLPTFFYLFSAFDLAIIVLVFLSKRPQDSLLRT
jgi:hypothetical protein